MKKIFQSVQKKVSKIEKRYRLIASSAILSFLMLFSTFFYFDKAVIFLFLLTVFSFSLTYFSLSEKIEGVGWFGFFFMPIVISISFYLFYFLFPIRWLTRLPFIIIYAISIYAVLLTSNIFNVGVKKSLQLYRAAFSVNFFYQTIASFLLFNFFFSLKQFFFVNALGTAVIVFLLSLHLFWTIRLKKYIEKEVLKYALFVSLVLAELSLLVSFVPVKTTIIALFLTTSFYSLSGLVFNYINERLFKETVREYAIVWIFVLLISLLSLSW